MAKQKAKLAPIDAKTDAQMEALGRDNVTYGDHIILIDPVRVWISTQAAGEAPSQKVELPRRVFARFARWYVTGSPTKPKSRK